MPGLQRAAQAQRHAGAAHTADQREAELLVGRKPAVVKGKAGLAHLSQHVGKVVGDEGGQHEAVMQPGAPARHRRLVGRVPEARHQGAQQELLHDAHARVRRHLKGAQLQEAQAAGGRVGREHLVDGKLAAVGVAGHVHQDVSQRSVQQPGRHVAPTLPHAVWVAAPRGGVPGLGRPGAGQAAVGRRLVNFTQRNLQLKQLVVACLVHAGGLAGGADEHAAEQVAQRGVVVPVQQQAG